jgi:hypothetical protein
LFGGLFRFLRVSVDFALGFQTALLQVGFEHAQPGAELFQVPFGILDGQTLGGAVSDHALLRVDVRLELFYFGDQLRFDLFHPGQQPDAGAVPSLDTVSARISTRHPFCSTPFTRKPQSRNVTTLQLARPVLRRVLFSCARIAF